jgi:hypothetical protein
MHVRLYHRAYQYFGGYYSWIESRGSGSQYNGLLTFALDRRGDDPLGQLYFEGKANYWGTYHPVGDPHYPRWFWIQRYF